MNASEVITALQDALDSDTSLRTALGTKVGDTKVFIRNTLPQEPQFPLILISDFAHAPTPSGQRSKHYQAAIDVTIFAQFKSNADDLELLHRLFDCVDDRMATFQGTTDSCRYSGFRLTTAAAAQSLDNYSAKVITYQGKLAEL